MQNHDNFQPRSECKRPRKCTAFWHYPSQNRPLDSAKTHLNNTNIVECPAGSFASAIQGFKPAGQKDIVKIRYDCRNAVGQQTTIKGTDRDAARAGSINGLAGTLNLSNPTAACPAGSFIDGIQGFRPNGQHDIVEIRYECKNVAGQRTAIKGTAAAVANTPRPVEGLVGTLNLNAHAFVTCPTGSFVSGIQGFRPNGRQDIVAIRYRCSR
jgi:hypothetical protein